MKCGYPLIQQIHRGGRYYWFIDKFNKIVKTQSSLLGRCFFQILWKTIIIVKKKTNALKEIKAC